MRISKRITSGLLCFSLMIGMAPAGILAAGDVASQESETVTASEQAAARGDHKITVPKVKGGLLQVLPSSASEDETVTITVKPNYGYQLDELEVVLDNGKAIRLKQTNTNVYTFVMPDESVEIVASFEKKTASNTPTYPGTSYPDYYPSYPGQGNVPFTDVYLGAWYYDAVKYCYDNDLMNGVTSKLFYPNMQVTRAMVCAVLCNLEGGANRGYQIYWDVPQGKWYSDSVNWCARNGIVNGYGNGAFGPEDPVTREQLVSMLHKYAAYKGYQTWKTTDLSDYRDASQISGWAYNTVSWAVAADIMKGDYYHQLKPKATANRAELATMLRNFDVIIAS